MSSDSEASAFDNLRIHLSIHPPIHLSAYMSIATMQTLANQLGVNVSTKLSIHNSYA